MFRTPVLSTATQIILKLDQQTVNSLRKRGIFDIAQQELYCLHEMYDEILSNWVVYRIEPISVIYEIIQILYSSGVHPNYSVVDVKQLNSLYPSFIELYNKYIVINKLPPFTNRYKTLHSRH